ncbi:MAG: hypothetical protein A2902_00180 [Elusimicrobia bacterium RIFCSPLOWO2_01_FULL_64_13]|nr:MAG: hypothetical protein A2636_05995 [Elusimicrobia bacterium RIFCSPHIGHO2_01_FULL_64_10]OGR97994.1 MAG: hypothetical protein A2902_00180 [Elusimicrobia bacterium RIFCSPLOWO2_01_FULL_64_13]
MLKQLEGSSALVTGGTGVLGRPLVSGLLKAGARVHLVLRPRSSPPPESRGAEIHEADILDPEALTKVARAAAPERVFHLAGKNDPSRTFEAANENLTVNTRGTLNVLEACASLKLLSFVFTSTTEVYGNNRAPFKESQRPDPPSPYAVSKLAAENFCTYYHRTRQVPATVLRLSSCYGPYLKKPRLVAAVFSACFNPGETLDLTSGRQKRDFLFAGDAVEALLKASVTPGAAGETINAAGKTPYSVKEVAEAILAVAGREPRIRWNAIQRRPNENQVWKTDLSKAKKLLGWSPATGLKQGLKLTAEWWRRTALPSGA